MSSYRDTPKPIKVYVDGFRIDTIDPPKSENILETAAMSKKVKAHLEGKIIKSIIPVPSINPQFIIITTELPN